MAGDYTISPDGTSITCHRCGLTSHNPNDVAHRYCGKCHGILDTDMTRQFDCDECGRHIIQFCAPKVNTCAACLAMPGWFNNPEVARIIDPDNHRNPRRMH